MLNAIYRGFEVKEEATGSHRFKVYRDGVQVYAARDENEAYKFVDKTKKEEAKKR